MSVSEKSEFIFKDTFDDEVDEDYIKNMFKLFSEDRKFKVIENKKSDEKKYPDKPFITSSLQQDAQKSYGFNVKVKPNSWASSSVADWHTKRKNPKLCKRTVLE